MHGHCHDRPRLPSNFGASPPGAISLVPSHTAWWQRRVRESGLSRAVKYNAVGETLTRNPITTHDHRATQPSYWQCRLQLMATYLHTWAKSGRGFAAATDGCDWSATMTSRCRQWRGGWWTWRAVVVGHFWHTGWKRDFVDRHCRRWSRCCRRCGRPLRQFGYSRSSQPGRGLSTAGAPVSICRVVYKPSETWIKHAWLKQIFCTG